MLNMRYKATILIAALAGAIALTGCGNKEKETEVQTETLTEAKTEALYTPTATAAPTISPTATPVPLEDRKFVAADDLNIRSKPNTDDEIGEVIDSLGKGDSLTVLEELKGSDGKDWYKITYTTDEGYEIEGYASKDFVTEKEEETKKNVVATNPYSKPGNAVSSELESEEQQESAETANTAAEIGE